MSKNSTKTQKPSSPSSFIKRDTIQKLSEELSIASTVFSGFLHSIACSQQALTDLIYSQNSIEVERYLLTRLNLSLDRMQAQFSDVGQSRKLLTRLSKELLSSLPIDPRSSTSTKQPTTSKMKRSPLSSHKHGSTNLGALIAFQNLDQLPAGLTTGSDKQHKHQARGRLLEPRRSRSGAGYAAERRMAHVACKSTQIVQSSRCFIRNLTPQAVRLSIPFGVDRRRAPMSAEEHKALRQRNRERYGTSSSANVNQRIVYRKRTKPPQRRLRTKSHAHTHQC